MNRGLHYICAPRVIYPNGEPKMPNKDDIRYQCTEQSIRNAYLSLAAEFQNEQITATSLCKAANISRNAFYQHYANVSDLYSTMVDEVVMEIRDRCLQSADKVISTSSFDEALNSAIIDALSSHEKLLRTVLPMDTGALSRRLADGIADSYVDAALKFGEHGGSLDHKLSCSFAAWGLIGLIRQWIKDSGRPISEARPYFDAMQYAISNAATDYLLQR